VIVRTVAPDGLPRPTGEEGHFLLDAIWSHFSKHLAWPIFDDIDRELYTSGLEWESAVQQLCPALLRGLDPNILRTPQDTQQLSLTIAGAANCAGSGLALKAFLLMVRTAATIEKTWRPSRPGERPTLTPEALKPEPGTDAQGLTKQTAIAAAVLGFSEPCFGGGGHDPAKLTWSVNFSRDVRPFAGVTRLEDYWQIRERLLGPERSEADRRPFSTRRPEVVLQPPLFGAPIPTVEASEPGPMEITCMVHPLIAEVAAERFAGGFYLDAVRSALQAVEHRVQTMVGSTEIGERLMGIALGKPGPKIIVTRSTGASLDSEQTGMQFLFKGAMGALRNPRSHGPDEKDERDEAQEILAFASFLMRRLDIEDEKRNAAEVQP
jgi:uncharacterized protein (TIGR02391 family)